MKRLSKYFIQGLIVIVPIFVTLFVISTIFAFLEDILGRYMPIKFPGLGVIAVVTVILLTGWLSSFRFLKRLLEFSDRLLNSIPVVKFIYKSIKQLSSAFFESNHMFKHAVLIPYPQPDTKTLGFIMSELSASLADRLPEEHVCVFVPMSVTMTAGFNIIVPKRDIIILDVTSESALQYILTAGSIMPNGDMVNK